VKRCISYNQQSTFEMRAVFVVLACLLLWQVAEAAYQEEAYPAGRKGYKEDDYGHHGSEWHNGNNGMHGVNGQHGQHGKDGKDGKDGIDGNQCPAGTKPVWEAGAPVLLEPNNGPEGRSSINCGAAIQVGGQCLVQCKANGDAWSAAVNNDGNQARAFLTQTGWSTISGSVPGTGLALPASIPQAGTGQTPAGIFPNTVVPFPAEGTQCAAMRQPQVGGNAGDCRVIPFALCCRKSE
jgi:hypothetical protein